MEEKRLQRFKEVVSRRQGDLTVILENVHDQHNVGAVMRTCDSVGIFEIFILQTDPNFKASNITIGKRTSSGARKWITVHLYNDVEECFKHVRSKYDKVFATHLDAKAESLYDLKLDGSVALLFGNEHSGVSKETLAHCDGNFIIPQVGFVKSLNISVACAVTLYEAYRQRENAGKYKENPSLNQEQQTELLGDYINRHEERLKNKNIFAKDSDLLEQ